MTIEQFTVQVNRLKDVYGEKAYPNERVKIIWNAVKNYDQAWWERAVSHLIGVHKFAPLMAEISILIAEESEREWQRQKEQDRKSSRPDSWLSPEEGATLCQMIVQRLNRNLDDPAWESCLSMIKGMADKKLKAMCSKCADSGVMFAWRDGTEHTFRCHCPRGKEDRRAFPIWDYQSGFELRGSGV